MKLLILGGTGYLGWQLYQDLKKKYSCTIGTRAKNNDYIKNFRKHIKSSDIIIFLAGPSHKQIEKKNVLDRQKILKKCVSFWLHLDTHLLKKRLINSKKRPLLNNEDLKSVLEKIYNEREEIYALADYKIDCKQLSIQSTANKIIKLYADN